MRMRFGDILYYVGLIGAAVSLLFAIDSVWVHQSGRSLIPIDGRFVSRDDMVTNIGIGIVAALVFWALGSLARSALRRDSVKQPQPK